MKTQKFTFLKGSEKVVAFVRMVSVFSFFLISFLACKPVDTPVIPEQSSKPYVVSLDEAIQVAQKYNWSDVKTKDKQTSRITANEIDTKETVIDENKNPLFHVINYAKSSGFIIVSADLRTVPILAYSKKGSFETKNIPAGVKEWFDQSKEQIKDTKRENKEINPIIAKAWKEYLAGELNLPKQKGGRVSNTNCYEWYTTGQFMCHYTSSSAGPFLNTHWGQGGIASALLAPSSGCNSCDKYNAGCGPVAMAQIMRYYQKPNWFTYDGMPDNFGRSSCGTSTPQQYELARLMIYCGSASGLNSAYGYWGTCNTFSYPWNIPGALSNYGYSNSGSSNSMDYQTMRNELYGGHPLILWGTTSSITNFSDYHIWVCDGIDRHNYSEYDCDTKACTEWSYEYYHMNWGWHGDFDGFYGISNFSPGSQGNYNTNMHMINGIRP